MESKETEKLLIERHPTMGDAADRRPLEREVGVYHPVVQVHPLMRDVNIPRTTAVWLSVAFILLIVIPGLWAVAAQLHPGSTLWTNWHNRDATPASKAIAASLLQDSEPSQFLRRAWGSRWQSLTHDRVGNVVVGRDGFLFYLMDVQSCTGPIIPSAPTSDEVTTFVQYSQAMQERGVHLVVLPIPPKVAVVPGDLTSEYPISVGLALNPGWRAWINQLRAQGVDVIDLSDDYWKLARAGNCPYMPQDSHWSPQGMQFAAGKLASHIQPLLGAYPHVNYPTRSVTNTAQGDLVDLMGLSGDFKAWPAASWVSMQVITEHPDQPVGDDAQVLLLGDSYTGIGSTPGTATDQSIGLSFQLMHLLGAPVQCIARCGLNLPSSTEVLAQMPQALRQKKVVIWEFTGRYIPHYPTPMPAR